MELARTLSLPLRALALGLVLVIGLPAAVGRECTPFNVVLSYLNGVSTWGPTTASGVAEIGTRDGEVRLSATGPPPERRAVRRLDRRFGPGGAAAAGELQQ